MLWSEEEVKDAYGIVYKATNLVNNKCYVGITTRGLACRQAQHLHTAISQSKNSNKHYFHRAINKYGSAAFMWEAVAVSNSETELKDLEKDHIWLNNSSNSVYGYNLTLGGEGISSEEALIALRALVKTKSYMSSLWFCWLCWKYATLSFCAV